MKPSMPFLIVSMATLSVVPSTASTFNGPRTLAVLSSFQQGYHAQKIENLHKYNWEDPERRRLQIANIIVNTLCILYVFFVFWAFYRSKRQTRQNGNSSADPSNDAKGEDQEDYHSRAGLQEDGVAHSTWALGDTIEDSIGSMD